ncbi:hypothetical protein SADUNF_Sadunf13G0106200 [Salix dunnii]|uniref:Protein kinase domain-containing protein n=1 Tax=Salix dunnii TaxID=1413687 RepID=A0A835JIB6_9ROSI|nr:hypothetical protein SADUNF_Sadunf13G0106200 [Salix dunnii]
MSTSSMADELDQESKRVQVLYPTYPHAYKILEEIGGGGAGATIHKAICVHNPWKSSLVAIKIIDLEQSPADFHSYRRESLTVSLHSHPNLVLATHCSFVVHHYLWVVMRCVMAADSLQSIISSYFSDGLQEPCVAIILKETLKGLHYIHDQVRLHTDIKAGNILIDTDKGSIKLADYGISVPIYDSSYSFRADIWSFGITALETAHGRPPLSHLPPSKSLVMKIKQRFGFSDYNDEKQKKDFKNKNFSKGFKDMVVSCLDKDPSKRPPAYQLLEEEEEKRLLPQRLRLIKGSVVGNLIEDGFVLDPVFHNESEDDQVVKMVRFEGETIIPNLNIEFIKSSGGSGDLEGSVGDHDGANMSGIQEIIEGLVALKKCLDE